MHDTDLRQAMSRMKARVAAEPGMEGAVEMIEAVGRLDARYVSRDRRHEETTQPLKVSSGGVDR